MACRFGKAGFRIRQEYDIVYVCRNSRRVGAKMEFVARDGGPYTLEERVKKDNEEEGGDLVTLYGAPFVRDWFCPSSGSVHSCRGVFEDALEGFYYCEGVTIIVEDEEELCMSNGVEGRTEVDVEGIQIGTADVRILNGV